MNIMFTKMTGLNFIMKFNKYSFIKIKIVFLIKKSNTEEVCNIM